jgi:hypothetical protein
MPPHTMTDVNAAPVGPWRGRDRFVTAGARTGSGLAICGGGQLDRSDAAELAQTA